MASVITYPKPFQSGFRLINGDDINTTLSADIVSTENGITAHAGGGQTNAYQLTTVISRVTTVTSTNDSVKLPPALTGRSCYVDNDGTNTMAVYPSGTDTLEDSTSAVSFIAGQDGNFVCPVNGKWYQNGTSSASITASTFVLLGATSGTTTLQASAIAGTTTLTLPAVTGTVASTTGTNLYVPDLKKCSGSVTANATITYANVTGLSFTVVAGTYEFVCRLPSTVASGTGGIKYAFNYTTTALTSIEATGRGFTASAVAVQHTTTTTTQTDLFTQAAVVIYTEITGTMVVSTGGTIDVQVAQNTSNASNTIVLVGASAQFTRIA